MGRLRVMRRNVDGLTYNAVASNRDVHCQLSTWKFICSHATDYSPCIYDLSIGQYWTRCEWPDLKLQGTDGLGHVTLTTPAPHIIFRSNAHVHTLTHSHIAPETKMHRYDVVERRIEIHWMKLKMDEMKYFDWCKEKETSNGISK